MAKRSAEILKFANYIKLFVPLDNLPDDRRTAVEISEESADAIMKRQADEIRRVIPLAKKRKSLFAKHVYTKKDS